MKKTWIKCFWIGVFCSGLCPYLGSDPPIKGLIPGGPDEDLGKMLIKYGLKHGFTISVIICTSCSKYV